MVGVGVGVGQVDVVAEVVVLGLAEVVELAVVVGLVLAVGLVPTLGLVLALGLVLLVADEELVGVEEALVDAAGVEVALGLVDADVLADGLVLLVADEELLGDAAEGVAVTAGVPEAGVVGLGTFEAEAEPDGVGVVPADELATELPTITPETGIRPPRSKASFQPSTVARYSWE